MLPLPSPTIRLAYGTAGRVVNEALSPNPALTDEQAPALLVSYVYLNKFQKSQHLHQYRDWVLDSGAFSAYNSGYEIKLADYIDCCKRLKDSQPKLTEVFALDVIGDWRGTVQNTEAMWAAGIEAIPCFHAGSAWSVLTGIAKDYPKIALGGVALQRGKLKLDWAAQCFARVWPCKIHGFGFGSETAAMLLPWHSMDASSWCTGPACWGRWNSFNYKKVSVRGGSGQQKLRAEVDWYLKLEAKARRRWAKDMATLEAKPVNKPDARIH